MPKVGDWVQLISKRQGNSIIGPIRNQDRKGHWWIVASHLSSKFVGHEFWFPDPNSWREEIILGPREEENG